MTKYYSVDDELFFPDKMSVFDILYDTNQFVIGAVYYSAHVLPMTTEDFSYSPDFITEHFDVMLSDIVGEENNYEFLTISEEARHALQQMLTTWIDRYIDLSKYNKISGGSTELHVTSEDIQQYIPCVKL